MGAGDNGVSDRRRDRSTWQLIGIGGILGALPTLVILISVLESQGTAVYLHSSKLRAESQNQTFIALRELEHKFSAGVKTVQQKFEENEQFARSAMTEMGDGLQASVKRLEASVVELNDRVALEVAIAKQGDTSSRSLVFNTAWGRDALEKLRSWRSTLFLRMAELYTSEEAASTDGGKKIIRVEPPGWKRYDVANPILTCPHGKLERVGGDGDGGKWLCMDGLLREPGCLIYSLGSAGNYDFETAMLKDSVCEVHTFDCTYDGQSLDMNSRHFYHKICLGRQSKTVNMTNGESLVYMNLPMLLSTVGHADKRVTLLKIDVEGYEFDTLSGWSEQQGCNLPLQVSMEVHYQRMYNLMGGARVQDNDFTNLYWPRHQVSLGEIATWFAHFANLGYGVVSREDNPYGSDCCAEFTMIQVEQPANCTTQ